MVESKTKILIEDIFAVYYAAQLKYLFILALNFRHLKAHHNTFISNLNEKLWTLKQKINEVTEITQRFTTLPP